MNQDLFGQLEEIKKYLNEEVRQELHKRFPPDVVARFVDYRLDDLLENLEFDIETTAEAVIRISGILEGE